jgi:hypothetical protein
MATPKKTGAKRGRQAMTKTDLAVTLIAEGGDLIARIEDAVDSMYAGRKKGEVMPDKHFAAGARDFLRTIKEYGQAALSPKAERIIHPENKDVLVRAMLRLEISFEELAKHFIEPNLPAKSHHAEYGYETIWELMQASFVIGSIARPTDPAKEFFKHEHAEEMRAAKGAKSAPAKTALINAVVAVRGAGPPAPTAWKEAECILDPVNRQLKSVGFEHVKVDKIRRVLEKPLRS